MKKKVLSLILAATMAAGVFAGCGSTGAKKQKTETKKDNGKGYEDCTLKMDWWGGDSRHEATQNAVKGFMQKYPGINVEVNFGAWSDWETAKAAEYTSGTNPDVQQTNFDWIGKYDASGDTYLDLNTVKDALDLSQWSKSDLDMTKDVKGGIAGIPVAMTGRLFFWNKGTWDKAGLELPKSLDDLKAAGPVFKEKLGDNYYPLVVGEYDRAILMTYYLQNETNKPIISKDGKLNYTEKDFQKGIKFIQDLEDEHVIPSEKYIQGEGADSMDKSARFINGEYAGIFEWDTAASKYVAALGDAASNFVVGGELSAKTKHPHEAALLLNYLLNDEEGVKAMGTQRGIPQSKAAYKTLEAAGTLDQMSVDAHKAVTDSKPLSWNPLFDDSTLKGAAGTAYTDVFDQLSYKQIDTDKAATNLFNAYKAICK